MDCCRPFGYLILGVHEVENRVRRTQRLLKIVVEEGKLADGIIKLEHRDNECVEGTGAEDAGVNLIAPQQKQQRDSNGAEQIHERRTERGSAHPAQICAEEPLGSLTKTPALPALHTEGLHNSVASN